jgi:hypothetical protein
MKRLLLARIAACSFGLMLALPASAMPIAPQNGAATNANSSIILARGGYGHGHMGRGGRGHHYGLGRGRGHHYGWSRGRHRGWR